MARIKLTYSKSEITNNLYTFGDEWMTADKQEYKGLYHRYTITNETYTGGTWNEATSKPLYPIIHKPKLIQEYDKIKRIRTTNYNAILPIQISITPQDIKTGYIFRYFLKKINELLYIEISKNQFNSYRSRLDANLYVAASCKWYITGPIESKQQPIHVPGVIELNTREIQRIEQTLPGISKKLTNPLQFYTDTDFVVPRDINLG